MQLKVGENKLRSFSIKDGITTVKAFWSKANHQRKSKTPEKARKGEDRIKCIHSVHIYYERALFIYEWISFMMNL